MLNENIKKLRKEKGMSQEELADKLNVVRQTVSKWEQGLSVPDSEMLIKISEIFDVPVSMLIGETVKQSDTKDELAEISEKLESINAMLAEASAKKKRKNIIFFSGFLIAVSIFIFAETMIEFFMQKANNSSLGIIGGADGPTAILVSVAEFSWFNFVASLVIAAVLLIGAILLLKRIRK